jgi:hydrogenase maturation factor
MEPSLPVGKLPVELLARLLERAPVNDPRLLLGPGIGIDCAVLDFGEQLLALKSDPITFATDEIGWYAVQVNANDIATTGATPRWLLTTLLLPEGHTSAEMVENISEQLRTACQEIGVAIIGGHTEITYGLERPILVGTMIGEVSRDQLVTPQGAQPGDRLLLTKGVPIEATAILAREFSERLTGATPAVKNSGARAGEVPLTQAELQQARGFLHAPGISVLRDAQIARRAGQVHAMHDPTEGGLCAALWELATACGHSLLVEPASVPVPPLSARICRILGLNPLAAIASGALLLAAPAAETRTIQSALESEGIPCAEIGAVLEAPPGGSVYYPSEDGLRPLPMPERDEIARLYEELNK